MTSGADVLPGSAAAAWTGKELLVVATVSDAEITGSAGPVQGNQPALHLIGLRLCP